MIQREREGEGERREGGREGDRKIERSEGEEGKGSKGRNALHVYTHKTTNSRSKQQTEEQEGHIDKPVSVVGANMSTALAENMEVVISSKLVQRAPSILNHHWAQQTEQDLCLKLPSQVNLSAVKRCSFLNLTYREGGGGECASEREGQ